MTRAEIDKIKADLASGQGLATADINALVLYADAMVTWTSSSVPYIDALRNALTLAEWGVIVDKAVTQAKTGDRYARAWLAWQLFE